MNKSLMLSVAAAAVLAATMGLATAQSVGQGGAKDAAPSMSKEPEMKKEAAPKSGPAMQEKKTTDGSGMNKDNKADTGAKPADRNSASDTGAKPAERNSASDMGAKPAQADRKSAADAKSTTAHNAPAPPREKQGQIVSAFKHENVREVTNVNFNIAIGAAVPASIQFNPLPSEIVEIYPEWSGYDFIIVGGRYLILSPETHEIIYILAG